MLHVLAVLVPVLVSGPASPREAPLKPFVDLAAALDRGFDAWIDGGEAAKAWPDWTSGERAGVRDALKEQGVAKARTFGFEFEVCLVRDGEAAAHYEFLIVIIDGKVSIGEIRKRTPGEGGLPGAAVEDVKDRTGSIARGARAIVRLFSGASGPDDIPLTDADELARVVSAKPILEEARRDIAEAKGRLPKIIEAVKTAKHDALRVRVDDQVFLAYDAGGTAVGGIRGDFTLEPSGALSFQLQRFLPFPKD